MNAENTTTEKTTYEKIVDFVTQKKQVAPELAQLQQKVYEGIVIEKAKVVSLEEAVKAVQFAGLESSTLENQLNQIKTKLDATKVELIKKLESLICEDKKEEFIKIVKKTKFIQRMPITYKFFERLQNVAVRNEENQNMLREIINEEMLLLSPYKIAELVQSESKQPAIRRFIDLYKPETIATDIESWIKKYAKKDDETQQIRVHFVEVANGNMFYTNEMVEEIIFRWSTMLGLSGNLKIDPETKEPLYPEIAQAVKEGIAIIKESVFMI